jgi:hypothetical protein
MADSGKRRGGRPRWDKTLWWAGVAGWAECHLGRRGEKTKKKMGHKDDWATMVLGCAEKKKKSFQILIQGIIFKFKF